MPTCYLYLLLFLVTTMAGDQRGEKTLRKDKRKGTRGIMFHLHSKAPHGLQQRGKKKDSGEKEKKKGGKMTGIRSFPSFPAT